MGQESEQYQYPAHIIITAPVDGVLRIITGCLALATVLLFTVLIIPILLIRHRLMCLAELVFMNLLTGVILVVPILGFQIVDCCLPGLSGFASTIWPFFYYGQM
jgi:hypothetical protein